MAKSTTPAPELDTLAEQINERWHAADRSDTEARIEIGHMLIEAKKQVKPGEWTTWCAHHIERSLSDINKVIALASADDPLGALEEERKKRREQMAKWRAAAKEPKKDDAHVGAALTPPATEFETKSRALRIEQDALEQQQADFESLISTWEQASPECRDLFLKHIGCSYCPPAEGAQDEPEEVTEPT